MKAFPQGTSNSGGMELRDYFAAKAMQGLIASTREDEDVVIERCAIWSYQVADAMMKAREQ